MKMTWRLTTTVAVAVVSAAVGVFFVLSALVILALRVADWQVKVTRG